MKWNTSGISSEQNKPQVGMRVRAMKPIDGKRSVIGEFGTVVVTRPHVGVIYDNDINGHNANYQTAISDGTIPENHPASRSWDATHREWNEGVFEIQ